MDLIVDHLNNSSVCIKSEGPVMAYPKIVETWRGAGETTILSPKAEPGHVECQPDAAHLPTRCQQPLSKVLFDESNYRKLG